MLRFYGPWVLGFVARLHCTCAETKPEPLWAGIRAFADAIH